MNRILAAGILLGALAACHGSAAGTNANGNDAEQAVPAYVTSIHPSLAFIRALNSDGKVYQYGTGFCVMSDARHSYFLTDDHVIVHDPLNLNSRPADRLQVILARDSHAMAGDPSVKHAARVVRKWSDPDLAILEIAVGNVPAVTIAPANPDPGHRIAIAGFPFIDVTDWDTANPEASMHAGSISAIKLGDRFIQYDAPTDNGNSGGPLFDPQSGDVYGIVESVIPGDKEDGPPSVYYDVATPMLVAMEVLRTTPLRLTVDPKILTTGALHVVNRGTNKKCSAALTRFARTYVRWAREHGSLKSMAAARGRRPPRLKRFAAKYIAQRERSATREMARAIRGMSGQQSADTQRSARAFLAAIERVNVADRSLAANFLKPGALTRSEESEGPLRAAAGRLNDTGNCL